MAETQVRWNDARLKNADPEKVLELVGVMAPGVDPFDIAERLGVRVTTDYRPADADSSGWIQISEDGHPHIWINPDDVKGRQRFTLAHELGHLFNDILPNLQSYRKAGSRKRIEDDESTLRRDGRVAPIEFAANRFAASLLMPEEAIVREAHGTIDTYKTNTGAGKMPKDQFIDAMAGKFRVSKAAMGVRLGVLGIIR